MNEEQKYAVWSKYYEWAESVHGTPLSYSAYCDLFGWTVQ